MLNTVILVNPAAARGRGEARFRRVASRIRDWCAGDVRFTSAPGEAAAMAAAAARGGAERIVVVGGDGTVNEVVNGLIAAGRARDVTLAHVPTGTGCDLARSLALPQNTDEAAAALPHGVSRPIDIARMIPASGLPRCFVNAANLGLGPRIAARVHRWKILGRTAYAAATAWELLSVDPAPMSLRHEDGEIVEPALNISICNGAYFGGGMCPDPGASLSSGLLHVVHVGEIGKAEALWLLPRLMRGTLGEHSQLRRLTAGRVEVTGSGPVEADGEIVGRLPAAFEILPGALNVLMPPG